ncbi:MAG TPA: SGNH/GDSL hydrolase family protein [Pyrinomonadaceae bacterium]|nr:SGNH/GDSL hydrolase family protein [Pyrinomonadaceae bacterium]
MPGRFRSILKKLALSLVTTLVCLVIVEVVLRNFFPIYEATIPDAFEYDPELGTRFKSGIHMFRTTDFQDEERTDQAGTFNFQEDWSSYPALAVAVGDSYTQGTGLPADISYPGQLDLLLNYAPDKGYQPKIGVVNLGVPGYGGEQSLIYLDRWWQANGSKAKYILYMGCDNDHDDDQLFKSGYRHTHLVAGNPRYEPFVRPLRFFATNVQLTLRIKLAMATLKRRSLGVDGGPNQGPPISQLESSVLERLSVFARDHNAKLVLSWSDDSSSYDWAKDWAAQNNIAFADWRSGVASVRQTIPELPLENNHSGGHHRGWVNHIIAEQYAAAITETSK